MPELGKKYTCYSCHTKFYDLGKPEPICPKCGADQREAPVVKPQTAAQRRAAAAEASKEEDEIEVPAVEEEAEEEVEEEVPEKEEEP